MESKLLKNIIKSVNDIRKKYKAIKTGKVDKEMLLEETFKSISKPLWELKDKAKNEIDTKIKNEVKKEISLMNHFSNPKDDTDSFNLQLHDTNTVSESPYKIISSKRSSVLQSTPNADVEKSLNKSMNESALESINESELESLNDNNALIQFYTKEYMNNSRNIDKAFGPKYNENHNTFEIGRYKIVFKSYTINIGGNDYPATQGLYELIFMKNPDDYSKTDLENYKKILHDSNVFRLVTGDDNCRIKGNGGEKYKKIIRKLITMKRGNGLMSVNNQKPNYVYWDNPNELVNRLRLLIASQQAGHSNHNNEIISISDELREANIII